MTPTCPYCNQPAEIVGGLAIYPHRPDLMDKNFWLCQHCDAYVGCHAGTDKPLGRLANAELRKAKMAAHAALDPLWKSKRMRRGEAYRWLSKELGIPFEQTHIGMFDVETCRRVVEACQKKMVTV